jgi:hypothetical protein
MKGRKELKISVPKYKPQLGNVHWDEEYFHLCEHLLDLSKHYGVELLKESINDCEWVINKNKQNEKK